MKTRYLALCAALLSGLVLVSCNNKSKTSENQVQMPSLPAGVAPSPGNGEFAGDLAMYEAMLDYYLNLDPKLVNASPEVCDQAHELYNAAMSKLNQKDIAGLHQVMWEQRNAFFNSPSNTPDWEESWIGFFEPLAAFASGTDRAAYSKEMVEVAEYHYNRIKELEEMDEKKNDGMMEPGHVKAAMLLMSAYVEGKRYELAQKIGKETLSQMQTIQYTGDDSKVFLEYLSYVMNLSSQAVSEKE